MWKKVNAVALLAILFIGFTSTVQAGPTLTVVLSDPSPDPASCSQPISTTATNTSYNNDNLQDEMEKGGYIEYKYTFTYQSGGGGIVTSPNPNPTNFIVFPHCDASGYFTEPGHWQIHVDVIAHVCDKNGNVYQGSEATGGATEYVDILGLDHINISPSSWSMYCGDSKAFTVTGYDQFGNTFSLDASKVGWSTNCGTMYPLYNNVSSTFTAGETPKKNGWVSVIYNNTFTADANIRVYPGIGNTQIDATRCNITKDEYDVSWYQIKAEVTNVRDSYSQNWGDAPDYPILYYMYWMCWNENPNHQSGWTTQTPYTFDLWVYYEQNVWFVKTINTKYYFDNGASGPTGDVSNEVTFWY